MRDEPPYPPKTKRKSGIPTGNAGEYFVMGELLRRGWDAQLADRNTQGYDLLAGLHGKPMQRVQVKTVRQQPWFVRITDFSGPALGQITIYVLLGKEDGEPCQILHHKNQDLTDKFHHPPEWKAQGKILLL